MKAFIVLLLLALLPGCRQMHSSPDLGVIYSKAAQQQHFDRNPIIVIPGILGSQLIDDRGRVVWGAFGSGAVDPSSTEGRRLMALPMSVNGWPRDEVKAGGALEKLQVSFGFNFKFDAYSGMLRALGAGGYLDIAKSDLSQIDYGPGHFTCFQFGYDWRRSCAENAALLDRFIKEKRRYVQQERFKRHGLRGDVKFDIIAHSMGGLVGRYYLMYGAKPLSSDGNMNVTWAGTKYVEKLILVGTPNGGSVYPLEHLRDGFKLAPFLPGIDPAVVATMPSVYELLPRTEDAAFIDEHSRPINLEDPTVWKSLGWGLYDPKQDVVLQDLLPDVPDPEMRREIATGHLAKMLRNASAFHRAMNASGKPPAGVEIHCFAGDAISTGSRVQVNAHGEPVIIDWIPGDGSVTRKSVLMDRRLPTQAGQRLNSPIRWTDSHFVFSNHIEMTSDPAFVDNVLHLLLERP